MSLSSKDVMKVFPFGNTRKTDTYSRVLNEDNIRRILLSSVDKDSYVISYDSTNRIIEFVLYGYYFKVNLSNTNISTQETLWAIIYINSTSNTDPDVTTHYESLEGNDDNNGNFTGLEIVTSLDDLRDGYKKLKLFENGSVPEESKYKLNTESIDLSGITEIRCGGAPEPIS